MKLKLINPNTTREMTEGIQRTARLVARPGTQVVAVSPESGPVSIESYYDEYLSVPGVLEEIRKGEAEGVDAYVIACYGDPGLQAAREVTRAPVLGIVEASLFMAAMLAARFSIVTTLHRVKTMIEDLVVVYGMSHRVLSVRTTPLQVLDLERDPEGSWDTVREEARKAVQEEDAEAVLLGCAGMAEFAESVEKEVGVPVIDGVVAAVKFAEALVDLGRTTSKHKTYRPPEPKQFTGALAGFGSG